MCVRDNVCALWFYIYYHSFFVVGFGLLTHLRNIEKQLSLIAALLLLVLVDILTPFLTSNMLYVLRNPNVYGTLSKSYGTSFASVSLRSALMES